MCECHLLTQTEDGLSHEVAQMFEGENLKLLIL